MAVNRTLNDSEHYVVVRTADAKTCARPNARLFLDIGILARLADKLVVYAMRTALRRCIHTLDVYTEAFPTQYGIPHGEYELHIRTGLCNCLSTRNRGLEPMDWRGAYHGRLHIRG